MMFLVACAKADDVDWPTAVVYVVAFLAVAVMVCAFLRD